MGLWLPKFYSNIVRQSVKCLPHLFYGLFGSGHFKVIHIDHEEHLLIRVIAAAPPLAALPDAFETDREHRSLAFALPE